MEPFDKTPATLGASLKTLESNLIKVPNQNLLGSKVLEKNSLSIAKLIYKGILLAIVFLFGFIQTKVEYILKQKSIWQEFAENNKVLIKAKNQNILAGNFEVLNKGYWLMKLVAS